MIPTIFYFCLQNIFFSVSGGTAKCGAQAPNHFWQGKSFVVTWKFGCRDFEQHEAREYCQSMGNWWKFNLKWRITWWCFVCRHGASFFGHTREAEWIQQTYCPRRPKIFLDRRHCWSRQPAGWMVQPFI